jgi:hypothetical protein
MLTQSVLPSIIILFKDHLVKFIFYHDQIVDVLTKPLVSTKFSSLQSKHNVITPKLSLRGRIEANLVHYSTTALQGMQQINTPQENSTYLIVDNRKGRFSQQ